MDERILSILGSSFYDGLGLPENGLNFVKKTDPVPDQANSVSKTLKDIPDEEIQTTSNGTKRSSLGHSSIRQPLMKQPRKVNADENLNNMYLETLNELKEIKASLQELNKRFEGIEVALINLGEIIKNK